VRVPGVDVNAENCIGSTPLHLAVSKGQVGMVQVLVEVAGVNLCAQEPRTLYTALHSAVLSISTHKREHSAAALQCGGEWSGNGRPIRLNASSLGHLQGKPYMVELLLRAPGGAAALTLGEGRYGRTALHIACHHGNAPIAAMLLRHPEVIEFLNALDDNGYSALGYACNQGRPKCIPSALRGCR